MTGYLPISKLHSILASKGASKHFWGVPFILLLTVHAKLGS